MNDEIDIPDAIISAVMTVLGRAVLFVLLTAAGFALGVACPIAPSYKPHLVFWDWMDSNVWAFAIGLVVCMVVMIKVTGPRLFLTTIILTLVFAFLAGWGLHFGFGEG